jgi:hypothetical protein
MEILSAFLFLCVIVTGFTCIYVSYKSQKENEELRKEINELKSQIDGYDR